MLYICILQTKQSIIYLLNITINRMETNFNLSAEAYEAPECIALDVIPQGVVCTSTTNGIDDWSDNSDFPTLTF